MGRKTTLMVLTAVVVTIVVALFLETASGPSFRAADHANMDECVRAIPTEWRRGSLEYDGAEAACYYIHVRDAGR
jgi:hypothetical protein